MLKSTPIFTSDEGKHNSATNSDTGTETLWDKVESLAEWWRWNGAQAGRTRRLETVVVQAQRWMESLTGRLSQSHGVNVPVENTAKVAHELTNLTMVMASRADATTLEVTMLAVAVADTEEHWLARETFNLLGVKKTSLAQHKAFVTEVTLLRVALDSLVAQLELSQRLKLALDVQEHAEARF
jgi:hypothetical protein